MKFDINSYRTDPALKQQGVWVDMGAGARIKIAAFDNEDFATNFRKMVEPYAKAGQDVPEEEQKRIMVFCTARYVVLDWEGIFDGEKALKYSVENAERLLNEIEFVRDRIFAEARKYQNFRATNAEAVAKN